MSAYRPQTRRDCEAGGWNERRPCPFVGCRYHLYLDASLITGHIKTSTNKEPWEMSETCALDVADKGSTKLRVIASHLGVIRERVRQIEAKAIAKCSAKAAKAAQ